MIRAASLGVTHGLSLAGAGTVPPIFPTGSLQPSPAYSGTFIPEIWSGKLIEKFYAQHRAGGDLEHRLRRRDQEPGRQGPSSAPSPTITIRDYLADGKLAVERPALEHRRSATSTRASTSTTILDDVMEIQSDINLMGMWSDDAAEQMKIVIDTRACCSALLGQAATRPTGPDAPARSRGNINLGVDRHPAAGRRQSGGAAGRRTGRRHAI